MPAFESVSRSTELVDSQLGLTLNPYLNHVRLRTHQAADYSGFFASSA
ncbi:hypothetical protein VCR6J2_230283 [Vibrio coralliirubri]|nr:hypothetical protein VCR6J2_230283 [Vibrio coralliirubri]